MTTFGFIGSGNMASAIVRGMVTAGTPPQDVIVTDAYAAKAAALADELGVRFLASNAELVNAADYVVPAVKPQMLGPVLTGLTGEFADRGPVVVSIAAGQPISRLEGWLPEGIAVIRVMPNVNAQIGEGMAAVAGNAAATPEQVETVLALFRSVGRAIEVAEKDMSAFSAVAGAGPALTYDFIDALARGALRHGIPKDLAVEIAAQTVLGSARLVLERAADGITPATLTDTVTSPGGTTIAGLVEAEDAGFTPAVVKFVDGVVARDRELGA
ncbi:MAG TPA: pyrroline-5-carboxylate reductase [Actinomycetaceae bacterium]|nr:pyrroline-5-carboxylate reductase [Actinomycetaceae bacterium]